ncbi:hypothetical protein SAMN05216452_3204 [Nitratireductor aquibiodomus]|uniref:Uncharacterized protein n=1 Tax=Nitratireductor aquibiodomus TaxID=204799 RepID=A0A1H4M8T7_9HYPH|nr:hypothetical protein [Nitratireductor aquibiodomus]SEB79501.1 hypothetical protein SAMN05216452_3204 [Nitratireductor aquibiodomus]
MSNDPTFTGFNGVAAQEDDFLPVPGELALDADKYRQELIELDLTDDQANELLAILWDIMRRFVELGMSTEICGSIFEAVIESSVSGSADGSLEHSPTMELPSKDNGKESA